jgi:RNA polymerase sigma-70 factor, ECF subfamily
MHPGRAGRRPAVTDPDPVFERLRPRLSALAYRMLGTVADAEDVLQEAFLRWSATGRDEVREPGAFLATVVTRLCMDILGSARARRESYVGARLPEPVLADCDPENSSSGPTAAARSRLRCGR